MHKKCVISKINKDKNTPKLYLALPKKKLMKLRNYLSLVAILLICVGCPNDDDFDRILIPPRERPEVAIEDDAEIIEYLQTHFYNYEEFEAGDAGFDFVVRLDTIAGENSDKTPIIDRPELTSITYDFLDVPQTLYILTARRGGTPGEDLAEEREITYADSVFTDYEGTFFDGELFDASVNPIWFDLPSTIDGFARGFEGFKGSPGGVIVNEDGTVSYEDFGSGAIFIPSGLGYFDNVPRPPGIPSYEPLIFTFQTYLTRETDHDGDGIRTLDEDLNSNRFLFDDADNPDNDIAPAFLDPDDDNDGVLTRLEVDRDENGEFIGLLDTDGDGVPNHLDDDDDGDGRRTQDEIQVNATTGAITFTDTDEDGIPDYLDTDN